MSEVELRKSKFWAAISMSKGDFKEKYFRNGKPPKLNEIASDDFPALKGAYENAMKNFSIYFVGAIISGLILAHPELGLGCLALPSLALCAYHAVNEAMETRAVYDHATQVLE